MKFPQKLDFAVRVMVQLARRYEQPELSQIDVLGESEAISVHFLAQILNELRKCGLVESRRGKNGGYILAHTPSSISLLDVIHAMDGTLLAHDTAQSGESSRSVSAAWEKLNAAAEREAGNITLENLVHDSRLPMFYI